MSFTFGVAEGISLAQFGLGALGLFGQNQVDYDAIYNATYQNKINQYRVEEQNKQIKKAFSAKIDTVKSQIENNNLAADAAWFAEQLRLNEINDAAAYQSVEMKKALAQALGSSAAREVYGKSARRGALASTLGAYGRTRAQQVHQLMNQQTASQMRMKEVERKLRGANKAAIASISVLPQFGSFAPAPIPQSTNSGWQSALKIGTLGLQAIQTGVSMTPKEMKFLGIPGTLKV
jgi:hypothetical protein